MSNLDYDFRNSNFPEEMEVFVNLWLDNYDYNSKARTIEAFTLFRKVIVDMLNTKFKQPCEYVYVKDLPEEDRFLLIKCLGQNVGIWDLHMYYKFWDLYKIK